MRSNILLALLPALAVALPYSDSWDSGATDADQWGGGEVSHGDDSWGHGGGDSWGHDDNSWGHDDEDDDDDDDNNNGGIEYVLHEETIDFEEYTNLELASAGLTAQGLCANDISPAGPLIADLDITGVAPNGDIFGVFGGLLNDLLDGGVATVTGEEADCPNAITPVFNVTGLCFGCALTILNNVLVGVAQACDLTVTPSTDGVADTPVTFTYDPDTLDGELSCITLDFVNITSFTLEVDAGLTDLLNVGFVDDIEFNYYTIEETTDDAEDDDDN